MDDDARDETPTGLPDEEAELEPAPLGSDAPEGEEPEGDDALPGIVSGGDPPDAG